jgi:hypothetical protein
MRFGVYRQELDWHKSMKKIHAEAEDCLDSPCCSPDSRAKFRKRKARKE